MKLITASLLTSACLVYRVFATTQSTYDAANQALDHIHFLTVNLTEGIKAWDGKDLLTAVNNIHLPTDNTISYTINATEILRDHSTTFDNTQAFKIGTPSQRLAYAVNASIAALCGKKKDFDAAQSSPIVVGDLTNLLNATQHFSEQLVSLVPEKLQPVADNLSAQIVASLQQGLQCFKSKGTASPSCSTAVIDPDRTYKLAVQYNGMRKDGSPYI